MLCLGIDQYLTEYRIQCKRHRLSPVPFCLYENLSRNYLAIGPFRYLELALQRSNSLDNTDLLSIGISSKLNGIEGLVATSGL